MMEKIKFYLISLLLLPGISLAGGGAGGAPGATEFTQILNNIQLADSYAQQTLQYQNQVMQYETMIRQLQDNPVNVAIPNLTQLATNQARIMAMGQDIATNMSKVDQNFANAFKNPQAASFGVRFQMWTNTALDGLKTALLNAGLQRENYASDEKALQDLVTKKAAISGTVGGLQTLADINAQQLQESMKLRSLILEQQTATSNYLASQVSKDQKKMDDRTSLATPYTDPIPDLGGSMKIINWNSVLQKK